MRPDAIECRFGEPLKAGLASHGTCLGRYILVHIDTRSGRLHTITIIATPSMQIDTSWSKRGAFCALGAFGALGLQTYLLIAHLTNELLPAI